MCAVLFLLLTLILVYAALHAIIASIIERRLHRAVVLERLELFPAVALLLGLRQVGKTTLAEDIAADRQSIYLDLKSPSDRSKLADPAHYLEKHEGKLVVLDDPCKNT